MSPIMVSRCQAVHLLVAFALAVSACLVTSSAVPSATESAVERTFGHTVTSLPGQGGVSLANASTAVTPVTEATDDDVIAEIDVEDRKLQPASSSNTASGILCHKRGQRICSLNVLYVCNNKLVAVRRKTCQRPCMLKGVKYGHHEYVICLRKSQAGRCSPAEEASRSKLCLCFQCRNSRFKYRIL